MNEITSALVHVFGLIVPEGLLVLAACVLFLGGTFRASRNLWGGVAVLALLVALAALWYNPMSLYSIQGADDQKLLSKDEADAAKDWNAKDRETLRMVPKAVLFASPLLVDRLALLIKAIALVGGLVLVLTSWKEVPDRTAAEFHGCVLLITAGIMLTGAANELITLFLSLELISIPTYILLYLQRTDNAAQEAAMKYFLLSVFSSALLLFGFSYLYGLTGTTNLPAIADALGKTVRTGLPGVGLVGLVLVVAGLGFRITAVPFHFYAPDVYQGTTGSAAALLAFVPKVAGFVALLRLFDFVPQEVLFESGRGGTEAAVVLQGGNGPPDLVLGAQVPRLLWILAVVTMSLGNVLALLQTNVKRLLAYSSVANAGYLLVGLAVARFLPVWDLQQQGLEMVHRPTIGGVDAVLFYLVAYGAMTVGAFAVLTYLSTPRRPVETIDDLAGLGRSHPGMALTLALFLFSLIGVPLTAGFVGKLLLFGGTMSVSGLPDRELFWFRILGLIMAVNAAIGAWYYLKLAAVMYLRSPLQPLERVRCWPGLAALAICVVITLGVGLYPKALLDQIDRALPHPSPTEKRSQNMGPRGTEPTRSAQAMIGPLRIRA